MEAQYGDMGNSIREKHKARNGDFVLFADDDNWYFSSPAAVPTEVLTGGPLPCLSMFLTQHVLSPPPDSGWRLSREGFLLLQRGTILAPGQVQLIPASEVSVPMHPRHRDARADLQRGPCDSRGN